MQSAALTFIVCQLSTKKEMEELHKTFKAIDKNSNGLISKEELIEGYTKMYSDTMSKSDIEDEAKKLFEAADTDGSGEIDYSEWAVATANKKNCLSDEKLKSAF
jgi:calcium-dependent protein kinase